MTTISLQTRMMDISLNLARVGNWTADNYEQKRKLIHHFLTQTERYVQELNQLSLPHKTSKVLEKFQKEFFQLLTEKVTSTNKDIWAEKALTWANILQHRAKVASVTE